MDRGRIAWALSVWGMLLAGAASAEVSSLNGSTYRVIVDRNPFALKPPPTNNIAGAPTNAPPAVPVNVKLSGITVDSSGKRVWILIPPPAVKGPAAASPTNAPQHFALREGDVQGDIQVLEINPRQNTVKILNAGVPTTLDFTNHSSVAVNAVPGGPGAPGGYPRGAPGAVPVPGAAVPTAVPTPPRTAAVNPAQPMVQPATFAGGGANPMVGAGAALADASGNTLRTIPSRPTRIVPQEPQPVPQIDPAVQAAMMDRQQNEAQARGEFLPPIPPH